MDRYFLVFGGVLDFFFFVCVCVCVFTGAFYSFFQFMGVFCVGKAIFASYTKCTAEATITDLLHS